ncbi:hypothetical protein H696_05242 [Fonticula alba]|uniref:Uncharacterized protein n=1 Tax=Fonticula alba TaxID=691883 RepID=A0A058Z230_FONAL|nr:hypothetical protein H696_05242 [Fonticula alba]KCV68325.1 hypothetical protein H696_05242 [Fonticula alba]|eukprot:XP_009497379.1 hypothetical protein H696_05242 [Fonticula alba]
MSRFGLSVPQRTHDVSSAALSMTEALADVPAPGPGDAATHPFVQMAASMQAHADRVQDALGGLHLFLGPPSVSDSPTDSPGPGSRCGACGAPGPGGPLPEGARARDRCPCLVFVKAQHAAGKLARAVDQAAELAGVAADTPQPGSPSINEPHSASSFVALAREVTDLKRKAQLAQSLHQELDLSREAAILNGAYLQLESLATSSPGLDSSIPPSTVATLKSSLSGDFFRAFLRAQKLRQVSRALLFSEFQRLGLEGVTVAAQLCDLANASASSWVRSYSRRVLGPSNAPFWAPTGDAEELEAICSRALLQMADKRDLFSSAIRELSHSRRAAAARSYLANVAPGDSRGGAATDLIASLTAASVNAPAKLAALPVSIMAVASRLAETLSVSLSVLRAERALAERLLAPISRDLLPGGEATLGPGPVAVMALVSGASRGLRRLVTRRVQALSETLQHAARLLWLDAESTLITGPRPYADLPAARGVLFQSCARAFGSLHAAWRVSAILEGASPEVEAPVPGQDVPGSSPPGPFSQGPLTDGLLAALRLLDPEIPDPDALAGESLSAGLAPCLRDVADLLLMLVARETALLAVDLRTMALDPGPGTLTQAGAVAPPGEDLRRRLSTFLEVASGLGLADPRAEASLARADLASLLSRALFAPRGFLAPTAEALQLGRPALGATDLGPARLRLALVLHLISPFARYVGLDHPPTGQSRALAGRLDALLGPAPVDRGTGLALVDTSLLARLLLLLLAPAAASTAEVDTSPDGDPGQQALDLVLNGSLTTPGADASPATGARHALGSLKHKPGPLALERLLAEVAGQLQQALLAAGVDRAPVDGLADGTGPLDRCLLLLLGALAGPRLEAVEGLAHVGQFLQSIGARPAVFQALSCCLELSPIRHLSAVDTSALSAGLAELPDLLTDATLASLSSRGRHVLDTLYRRFRDLLDQPGVPYAGIIRASAPAPEALRLV